MGKDVSQLSEKELEALILTTRAQRVAPSERKKTKTVAARVLSGKTKKEFYFRSEADYETDLFSNLTANYKNNGLFYRIKISNQSPETNKIIDEIWNRISKKCDKVDIVDLYSCAITVMQKTKTYLDNKIDWKLYNFLKDHITAYQDDGIYCQLFIRLYKNGLIKRDEHINVYKEYDNTPLTYLLSEYESLRNLWTRSDFKSYLEGQILYYINIHSAETEITDEYLSKVQSKSVNVFPQLKDRGYILLRKK